jgi:hypothetical protein
VHNENSIQRFPVKRHIVTAMILARDTRLKFWRATTRVGGYVRYADSVQSRYNSTGEAGSWVLSDDRSSNFSTICPTLAVSRLTKICS